VRPQAGRCNQGSSPDPGDLPAIAGLNPGSSGMVISSAATSVVRVIIDMEEKKSSLTLRADFRTDESCLPDMKKIQSGRGRI
jgi:hypothetical protein